MRLHRLDITAFGPFGAAQRVDFDELSAAGLFLLHGPTGAGKTSVLDAVCYALYGAVPGARQSGQGLGLRSDHATPDVRTEIRLELSVAGQPARSHPAAALGAPEIARQGHDDRQGPDLAARIRLGGRLLEGPQSIPPGDRRGDHATARNEPRTVLPGRAAAPGRLRALPAGRRRGPRQTARQALRHPPLRRGRKATRRAAARRRGRSAGRGHRVAGRRAPDAAGGRTHRRGAAARPRARRSGPHAARCSPGPRWPAARLARC